MDIIIKMKSGIVKKFLHEGRPGGSYSKSIKYVPGFVVIEDEWGKKISIPASEIEEIEEKPNRY